MQAERNALGQRVFPVLRRWCAERGIAWFEVDLRWGITEAQSKENLTLSICLDEIDRCRPLFLGLLGNNYGSLATLSEEEEQRWPWLRGEEKRSYTELEILHALNDSSTAKAARFFYSAAATDNSVLRVICDLRSKGISVSPYADLDDLCSSVLASLQQQLAVIVGTGGATVGSVNLEQRQRIVVASHGPDYLLRGPVVDGIERAIRDRRGTLIVSPRGGGKSAALASWIAAQGGAEAIQVEWPLARRIATCLGWDRRPRPADDPPLVLDHFATAGEGASLPGGAFEQLWRRLHAVGLAPPVPSTSVETRCGFAEVLRNANARRPLVLLMDAVNLLDPSLDHGVASVLPDPRTGGIPMVVTLDGAALAADAEKWRRLGWRVLPLPDWKPVLTRRLAAARLRRYAKTLDEDLLAQIAEAPAIDTARRSWIVIEQLRLFGYHRLLQEEVDRLASVENAVDLARSATELWRKGGLPQRQVHRLLILLSVARAGLREAEIADLLNPTKQSNSPVPALTWLPLREAIAAFTTERDGRVELVDDSPLHVRKRPASPRLYAAARRTLLWYFLAREFIEPQRVDEEVNHQLAQLHDTAASINWLGSLPRLGRVWRVRPQDVRRVLSRIGRTARDALMDTWLRQIPSTGPDGETGTLAALSLWTSAGRAADAVVSGQAVLQDHIRDANSHDLEKVRYVLNLLTLISNALLALPGSDEDRTGQLDVLRLLRFGRTVATQRAFRADRVAAMIGVGVMRQRRGEIRRARHWYDRAMQSAGSPDAPETLLAWGNLAECWLGEQQWTRAANAARRHHDLAAKIGDVGQRIDAIHRLSIALIERGRIDEALDELDTGIRLSERVCLPDRTALLLRGMIDALFQRGGEDTYRAVEQRLETLRDLVDRTQRPDLARAQLHYCEANYNCRRLRPGAPEWRAAEADAAEARAGFAAAGDAINAGRAAELQAKIRALRHPQ